MHGVPENDRNDTRFVDFSRRVHVEVTFSHRVTQCDIPAVIRVVFRRGVHKPKAGAGHAGTDTRGRGGAAQVNDPSGNHA